MQGEQMSEHEQVDGRGSTMNTTIRTCYHCGETKSIFKFGVHIGKGPHDGWLNRCCMPCWKEERELEALDAELLSYEALREALRNKGGEGKELRRLSICIRDTKKFMTQLKKGQCFAEDIDT